MTNTELQLKLTELDACADAKKFCEGKTLQQAWDECTKSEWMFWLIIKSKTNANDKQLRLIAVRCARRVQHLMTDQRSLIALDVAERFANGEATEEELDAARAAAWAAAGDAAGAAARDAAWDAQCKIIREFIPKIEILP